ncbi:spinster family MFS transporter [Kordiimonas lacus]|uniref:Predicted arabinose efflux permease, MFS family n=1 Tax=Kordiimonas lacus TaxID=637679 RepID=A0A1G7B9U8_9PROT|nr:MFS transporter [Kordiimonas lacus]SDE23742.1 Predicted arabinose efflux permease, MFS family [Kordiimonas lacus]
MKDTVETPPVGSLSNRARTYALVVLTIVYAFNFIDRQILVILQEAIKNDLGLSDTQLGLLSGFSFAIFYTVLGLPIARLADRMNRRNIISIALAIWSGMTALSGMAQNFTQLLLARMGVGVGEAGGSPPAHSMISDMFTAGKRSTALAVYSAGLYLGIFLGYTSGGYLQEAYDWRTTFMIVGIPGVLLAIILRMTVQEPPRGLYDKPGSDKRYSLVETFQILFKLKSFPFIAFGCAMSAFVSYGTSNFMPSFMIRYHGISPSEIGLTLGLVTGIGGMIGTFLGGALTDRFGAKDARWYLWLPGLTAVTAIPLALVTYHTSSKEVMLGTYFLVVILSTLYLAPSIAVTHRLVPPSMRALSSAVLFLVLNLIGMGLGPVLVGAISDFEAARTGADGLRTALTIGTCIAIVKGYLFWTGGRKLPEDLARD